ncbi:phosphoethanolamine transferase [Shewanella sp. YIC-542]|uniref:phosphoethanolamine transferase n=1 Tax=Shewanella mytili TaxID=3377111 RepID=UPI00398E40E8
MGVCVLKSLSTNRVTFILALFFVTVFNIPFFSIVKHGLENQSHVDPFFVATIPVFMVAALGFLFSVFSIKYLLKPFFIVLILLSSSVFFAAYKYGVVFDTGMIENTFQTNSAEAFTYVNWASIGNFLLTGLLPAWLLYKADIVYQPLTKELLHKVIFMVANLAVVLLIAFGFMQNYASFVRNNDQIKHYIVPTYFIGSASKYVYQNYLQTPITYQQLGTDATVVKSAAAASEKPKLLVLVVGETARAMNYEYYGYQRPTNAYTKDLGLIAFDKVRSCGTATAVSLPCMFSRMDRKNYNGRRAKAQDTAVDVLHHAGVNVLWVENDSGCKGVCDRVPSYTINVDMDSALCDGEFCQDQVMVDKLDEVLSAKDLPLQDRLIVLHIVGSHGPTYYRRYPEQHRKFTPDCPRSDIQNCSHDELVNTYDNTILYTDYVLSEVVKRLQQQQRYAPAMMYLSDHGESLGEKGLYLHGTPYSIAPAEQTTVPWLTWMSDSYAASNGLQSHCLDGLQLRRGYSQDNLFDTLLGLFNVNSSVYQSQKDIFRQCRS